MNLASLSADKSTAALVRCTIARAVLTAALPLANAVSERIRLYAGEGHRHRQLSIRTGSVKLTLASE